MELGKINPGMPPAINLEFGVGYQDAIRVLMLTGHFVVRKKVCKLVDEIQHLHMATIRKCKAN